MKNVFLTLVVISVCQLGCSSECDDACNMYFDETCPSKAPDDKDCSFYCDTPQREQNCKLAFDCLNKNKRLCITSESYSDYGDVCNKLYIKCLESN